ncbi:MAG: hypothetical protein Q3Y08_05900 [Butyricicoccus sp.]|nr:hypothetical protein [Butyricicoccus sp.]
MKYFTEIDAVEGLEAVDETDGIMLTGEECLMRTEAQRLLMQSLLLDPPETEEDARLDQLYRSQTRLWAEKIAECAQVQLCIRLPDRPLDAFLPSSPAELSRVATYMSRSDAWLRDRVQTLHAINPDLSCRGCRMMIANPLLFQTFLHALFETAQTCGVSRLSILLPFIADSQEVIYLKGIIDEYAQTYEIACTLGIEIATPRAACIAEELAGYADAIVFNVDELVQLLYGMSRHDTRKVISRYLHEQVFRYNPFTEFDEIGIGTLLSIALEQIRAVHPQVRLSALGQPTLTEKGRKFCRDMGIDILIGPQHLVHLQTLFQPVQETKE